MANLSIKKLDDDTVSRLRIRAAQHQISMEEEARRILRLAVISPNVDDEYANTFDQTRHARFSPPPPESPRELAVNRLGDLSVQLFGSQSGVELALPRQVPHEPLSFAE